MGRGRGASSCLVVALVLLMWAGMGCAPRLLVDDVPWVIEQSGRVNASSRVVRNWPCLRLDDFLLDELLAVEATDDREVARRGLLEVLQSARGLALYMNNNEIDRLPESTIQSLYARHFNGGAVDDGGAVTEGGAFAAGGTASGGGTVSGDGAVAGSVREIVRARFWELAGRRYETLRLRVMAARSSVELHRIAAYLSSAAMQSPKDRRGHGAILAWISDMIEVERGPLDRGGKDCDVYEPGTFVLAGESHENDLLRRYAPLVVQERLDPSAYVEGTVANVAPDTDLLGTVRLEGTSEKSEVVIDTTRPSVYCYWQTAWIHGQPRVQLTYTYWFPRHAQMKAFDPEAGRIEGATLRITLDGEDRPMIFETVLNCGCYHRCYPLDRLEEAACDVFGGPLEGKRFCVERAQEGLIDWIVPETVPRSEAEDARPMVFSRAGYHGLAGVAMDSGAATGSDGVLKGGALSDRNVLDRRRYTLRDYRVLERLAVADGYASMFGPDGLVRGAERLEGVLMAPTGMLNAGQPRQRGTQLLHWDQYDFDDPHLLEQCLRIPKDF